MKRKYKHTITFRYMDLFLSLEFIFYLKTKKIIKLSLKFIKITFYLKQNKLKFYYIK